MCSPLNHCTPHLSDWNMNMMDRAFWLYFGPFLRGMKGVKDDEAERGS